MPMSTEAGLCIVYIQSRSLFPASLRNESVSARAKQVHHATLTIAHWRRPSSITVHSKDKQSNPHLSPACPASGAVKQAQTSRQVADSLRTLWMTMGNTDHGCSLICFSRYWRTMDEPVGDCLPL